MEIPPETEHDTIAWLRVGIVVISTLIGLTLLASGSRTAAYVFLGYALFGATVMLVFKTWRSSSEVNKVHKSHTKRMVRNIPRVIFRFILGTVAFFIVIAIGLIPAFFISNETHQEYEQLWNAYVIFLVVFSIAVYLWAAGFFMQIRQIFSDVKAIRNAANKAKKRRAQEKSRAKRI